MFPSLHQLSLVSLRESPLFLMPQQFTSDFLISFLHTTLEANVISYTLQTCLRFTESLYLCQIVATNLRAAP